MSLDELYQWLKALHVASVIVFAGGVPVLVVLTAEQTGTESLPSLARTVHRWDQAVTMPAMLLVLALKFDSKAALSALRTRGRA